MVGRTFVCNQIPQVSKHGNGRVYVSHFLESEKKIEKKT